MTSEGRVPSRCRCVEVETGLIDATACRADRHRDFAPRLRAEPGRVATHRWADADDHTDDRPCPGPSAQ